MARHKRLLLTTTKFLLVGICLGVFTVGIGTSSETDRELFVGNESHDISLREAKTLVENFRQGIPPDAVIGGFFGREAIEALLSQPGAVGVRAYFARKDDGSLTLVIIGVNAQGEDIVEGEGPMDRWFPCPPFCPENSELLRSHYALKDR
jgi:hypothetical protein